ncbi:MAG: glycosyltransferase family 2 protein [Phenylobacterium sp.]|uniref:glycosyltransferase family 2 protein n=1 Tax=Phenylobacterium sp. TaxID=1871053 RepID=UPI00391B3758
MGIATVGRKEIVSKLLEELAAQTRLPDLVLLSPGGDGDLEPGAELGKPYPVQVVRGDRGLPAQRNTILRAAGSADIILFFDDDFVPAADYIAQCVGVFERDPEVVVVTGTVIADGIKTSGIALEEAKALIAADLRPESESLSETYGGYGCNMAMRAAPIYAHDLRFDEALPLYGWLEDLDFSRQIARYGKVVRTNLCRGVHMGTKQGRNSGVRFGYSQIANPVHMVRKGTLSKRYAWKMMSRNMMANVGRCFAPEPWVDRRGRLWGNVLAAGDLIFGRLDPRKILEFK